MDIDEPRTPKLADMESRGPHKHWCKVCSKEFPAGRALGDHMSCHRHAGMQRRSTPSPPAIAVDIPVSLLGPSDDKPLLPSLETQCGHCSKEFSNCQSLRGDMRMHSEKNVNAKPNEEPAGLVEALANANGDYGHNEMLFSPVKHMTLKRLTSESALGEDTSLLQNARKKPNSTVSPPENPSMPSLATQNQDRSKVNDVGGSENVTCMVLKETRKYYCKNYGECCPTFQRLGWHRRICKSQVRSGKEKFYCKHCGKDFPTLRSAASHMGKCKSKAAAHTSARHVLQDDDQDNSS